jgi:hypothetical protein
VHTFWVVVALLGLAAFVLGLSGAAWRGYDSGGRPQPSLGRWRWLAAAGLALLLVGAWSAGVEQTGLSYPRFGDEAGG